MLGRLAHLAATRRALLAAEHSAIVSARAHYSTDAPAGGEAFAAAAVLATDPAAAASLGDSTAAAGEGVLSVTMAAVDALHSASCLPWWATLAALGVGVRTALLPVSLKAIKAGGALMPLLQEARRHPAPGSPTDHREEEPPQQQRSMQDTLRRFHSLRLQSGAPHPAWIIGSPLVQLPVFITAMSTIRTMSMTHWPGFETGGVAWFPDLTLPAVDLAAVATPMGAAGVGLPLLVTLCMYVNIDLAFSAAGQREGVLPWVLGKVRLALEWAVVPLFVAALQLPQGALCYWAASSAYAAAQNRLLKVPRVRARLLGGVAQSETGAERPGKGSMVASGGTKAAGHEAVPPELALPPDAAALLLQAAELQSKGNGADAAEALRRLLRSHPGQPRALFALGQVQSGLKDWAEAEQCYLEAARHENDAHQRARSWFGAGVALHMQGEEETAAEAFGQAAEASGGGQEGARLRVRAWVSQATIEEKLGRRERAVALLRRAAQVEPRVEELYLKPLLWEGSGAGKGKGKG